MDRCILKNKDVETLFAWRDRNKDLVRRGANPMKGIEVILPDVKSRVKYVRTENILNIHYAVANESFNYKIEIITGKWKIAKQPAKGFGAQQTFIEDIVGMYFALMALIVYGDDVQYTEQELDIIDSITTEKSKAKPAQKQTHIKRDNVIYLFNKEPSGKLSVKRKGERRSPRGQFNVRGHFRHLKGGKVIWIAEYKKGTGTKKNKTYKL